MAQIVAAPEGWLALLREHKRHLSPAEGRVARVVLGSPEQAMRLPITALADLAGVGEATVSRLARRLGFSSFHAFKIAIAQDLAPDSTMRSPLARSGSDHPAWAVDSADGAKQALDETLALFDDATLGRVVDRLVPAGRIELYGSGASGITAGLAQQRFMLLGLPASTSVDPHVQLLSAATLGPADVVLGITHSGSTRDLHASMTVAKDHGAYTVCVTATPRSPLAALADDVLLAGGSTDALVTNLFHQMPVLFVLELVAQACAERLGPQAEALERRAAEAIAHRIF